MRYGCRTTRANIHRPLVLDAVVLTPADDSTPKVYLRQANEQDGARTVHVLLGNPTLTPTPFLRNY